MLRLKKLLSVTIAQRPHSEETDINKIENTSVVQSTRVAPSLGEIMCHLGGLERLDQTRLKQAPSDMEDEQDINRHRLTYFAAVSKSIPDLALRPGGRQSSNILSFLALLAKCSPADDQQNIHVKSSVYHSLNRVSWKTRGRNQRTLGHAFITNPDEPPSSHRQLLITDHNQRI